ncbi:MAG: DnaB-like helicase C-terminal domain-containing protein [Candidatus Hodarchaeales archaeon]
MLDVLDRYGLQYQKRGNEWWLSCPFHQDTVPSFSISLVDGRYLWYCFSCRRGGDVITFIQNMEHISRYEAIQKYKSWGGNIDYEVANDQVLLTRIIEGFPYADLSYRGISSDIVREYGIRDCDKINLRDFGLGVIEDCLIYPFYDIDGIFGAYIRSKKEKAFLTVKTSQWRDVLWGVDKVRDEPVYIFEGQNDVLVARRYGLNAVAMCGLKMLPGYWEDLRQRNLKNVIFVPDGDLAGRRFLEDMIGNYPDDFIVRYIELAHGDPDEAILEGRFDNEPKYPIVWYADTRPKTLDQLKKIAEKVRVLPDLEKVYFRKYLLEKFGDDIAPYLFLGVKPDYMAEVRLLSNALVSGYIRNEVIGRLNPSYFHSKKHRKIFNLLIKHENVNQKLLESMGINFYIDPDIKNYKAYLSRVINVYRLEEAERAYKDFRYDGKFEEFISKIYKLYDGGAKITDSKQVATAYLQSIEERLTNSKLLGIPLGARFKTLNDTLLGWIPGKLIMVLGNTGEGKTTLACNFVNDLMYMGENVIYVSLEPTPEEIISKILSMRTGINSVIITAGKISEEQRDVLKREISQIKDNLVIVSNTYSLHSIVAVISGLVSRKDFRFVVIDYFQLIQMSGRKERWEQLEIISQTIKTQICNKLGVTVLVLSQLGRYAKNQAVPTAQWSSGSYGAIADVDVAMTIRNRDGEFNIFIDKHRYNVDNVLIRCNFDRDSQIIGEI